MAYCPHCNEWLLYRQDRCPACLEPIHEWDALKGEHWTTAQFAGTGEDDTAGLELHEDEVVWTPIARFRNAAEAGFFGHELQESEAIPSKVTLEENFDALGGHWSVRFVLTVPEDRAEDAVRTLQQMVSQTEGGEFYDGTEGDGHRASQQSPPSTEAGPQWDPEGVPTGIGSINWVPIALTLAAGSAVIWGAKTLYEHEQRPAEMPRRPVGGQPVDLWDKLSSPSHPWTQPTENGEGIRTLWIRPDQDIAVLREDANGDGHFEKETHFRREALEPDR